MRYTLISYKRGNVCVLKIAFLVAIILQCKDVHCGIGVIDGTISQFDNSTKELFVRMQNLLRERAGAANMKKLSWDDTLAKDCESLVGNCHGSPYGDVVYTTNISGSGENYFWHAGYYDFHDSLIQMSALRWESHSSDNVSKCDAKHPLCEEYLRQVWATNDKMGCAAAHCSANPSEGSYFAGMLVCCKFGPIQVINETQYEDPNDVFIPGLPCSRCEERYTCEGDLCVPCETAPSSCPNTTTTMSTLETAPTTLPNATTASTVTTDALTAPSEQVNNNNATTKTVSMTTSGCRSCLLGADIYRYSLAIWIVLLRLFFDL